jgi:hypothetical protein
VTPQPLILPPEQAFAHDFEPPPWFFVLVQDYGHLVPQPDRKIVFHGVNKSGSFCISKVILDSFSREGRKAQFHRHYYSGISYDRFFKLVQTCPPPGFFIGHDLFRKLPLEDPSLVIITQFRHPLPRLLSVYEWLRKKHLLNGGAPEDFSSVEQFVRRHAGKGYSQIAQFAVKYGEDSVKLHKSLTPRQLFERSIENIKRHVYFTGIAELFEETIFLVAHICGIRNVSPWKKDGRNVDRPMVWTLPQATVDLVHEVYRYDFELYDWAKRRFKGLLEKITIAGDFRSYRAKCSQQYKDRLLSTGRQAAVEASGMQTNC